MQIKETVYFSCSRETLFSHIEDPNKQKLWIAGLQSNEPTSPSREGVGSTFRMGIKEGARTASYDGEVTAYDKPSRLEVRFWGGNFPKGLAMRVDYRLSEAPGQTRLDYVGTLEGKVGFFMRMMSVFFKVFGRMQLRGFFKKLRSLVEVPAKAA